MAEELSCLIVAVKGSLISLLRLLYLLNQPDSRPGHTHKSSHLTETRLDWLKNFREKWREITLSVRWGGDGIGLNCHDGVNVIKMYGINSPRINNNVWKYT